ncbi:uncharacterized protein B0T23DRAFT_417656 [Neurospora hispaniola]|uniref:Uncharacterized protein n=1 Tax=Neurospora hispaniola TaxID=588809 RepID=A0AAJ0MW24_9PEZI|nr:hypothetical protein B0T23DRAFT_417656 [Neurospora hispaniola]
MVLYFTLGGLVRDFPENSARKLTLPAGKAQMEQLVRKEMQNAAMFQPTMQFIQYVGPMQPQMPPPGFNASQLWPLLCTNWNGGSPTVAEDLLAISKADVPASPEIAAIVQGSEPDRILVLHDEQSLEGSSSLSTLSYLCALITEMMSAPGMIRLCFFCGLHSADGDVLGGGYGLMRSLALQLLQPFGNANLSTTGNDLNLLAQGLMMNDLSTACSVFKMLLHNVPAGVVYILVDGAFWYASGSHGDEMAAVMAFLNRLVLESRANANRGLVLKIFVTNPTPSQRNGWDIQAAVAHLEQSLFEDDHELDVQRMMAGF